MNGVADNPFVALGLPARAGLADEDVRAAWKRIAAATHPDRDDGGDAARFGAAAAAYDTLRTAYGRGEALADLGLAGGAPRAGRHARLACAWARSAAWAGARPTARGAGRRRGGRVGGGGARRRLDAGHRRPARGGAHLAGRDRPPCSGAGPVAMGRAGSVIQFDQEPT